MGGVYTVCNQRGCGARTPAGERYCPEHRAANTWKRSGPQKTSERGYGSEWRRMRGYVLAGEPLCRPCKQAGRTTAATEVDHITPKAQGGTDEIANLQPICRACHRTKTAKE